MSLGIVECSKMFFRKVSEFWDGKHVSDIGQKCCVGKKKGLPFLRMPEIINFRTFNINLNLK
jgi:hypothetical protein